MAEKLYRPREVADRLSYEPGTILNWLRAGRLPGVKIGTRWRVRESDLAAFEARMEQNTTAQRAA